MSPNKMQPYRCRSSAVRTTHSRAETVHPLCYARRSRGLRRSGSSMKRPFDLFEQIADVVVVEMRINAHVLCMDLERLSRGLCDLSLVITAEADQFVDRLFEGLS